VFVTLRDGNAGRAMREFARKKKRGMDSVIQPVDPLKSALYNPQPTRANNGARQTGSQKKASCVMCCACAVVTN